MPRHIIHQPRYLGENLKRVRRLRDWTVERLATEAGVSKAYLSMIETGKRSPHWSLIMKILHPLGETLCSFFTSAESIAPPEDGVHSGRESRIVVEGDPPNEKGQFVWPPERTYTHILTSYHPGIESEVVEIYLPPHTEWAPAPVSFGGRVVCWGAQGRLLLVLDATEYVMHEGECLHYTASTPHTLRNYTDYATRALLTISPVSF